MNLRHLVFFRLALRSVQSTLAIHARLRGGRVQGEAIEAKEFRRDRSVAVVAPGHSLANPEALKRATAEGGGGWISELCVVEGCAQAD